MSVKPSQSALAALSTTVAAVTLGAAPAVTPPPETVSAPPRVKARAASGVAGKPVRLTFVALGNGSAIRRHVTVGSGGRTIFSTTTKPARVVAQRVYGVVWRPGKTLRGSFRFCVRFVAKDGAQSPPSCASVTIRR